MYAYQCSWSHYWLHWVQMRYVFWCISVIFAHEVLCIYDISMAFEGHNCWWHIHGYSMLNKSCSFFLFWLVYSVMFSSHVECSISPVGHAYGMWQAYFPGAYSNVNCIYSSAPGCIVHCSKLIWSIYWHSCLTSALELICMSGIWGEYLSLAHIWQ